MKDGECMVLPGGLTPFEKTIPSEIFYFCLEEARRENNIKDFNWSLMLSQESNPLQRRILASRERIFFKRIENASTGGV